MAIVQFANLSDAPAVLLPPTTLQSLIGNPLDPCVMGNSLDPSPFATRVGLAAWSVLRDIPGAFLAVPITVIKAMILPEFAGARPIAILSARDRRP